MADIDMEILNPYRVLTTEVFTVGDTPTHPKGRTLRADDPNAGDHPRAAIFTVETQSVKVSFDYPRPEQYNAKSAHLQAVYETAFTDPLAVNEVLLDADQKRLELRTFIAASPSEQQFAAAEAALQAFVDATRSIGLVKMSGATTIATAGQYKGHFRLTGNGPTPYEINRLATGMQLILHGTIRGDVVLAADDIVRLIAYTTEEVEVLDSAFDGHTLSRPISNATANLAYKLFVEGHETLLRMGFVRAGSTDAMVAVTYLI